MSAIRSVGGKAEVLLRSALQRRGLRFRRNLAILAGTPDIVFTKAKVAIFVDGDFWHARVLREGGMRALRQRLRTCNRAYWISKFSARVLRDDAITQSLREVGWTVLRFWESEVSRDPESVASLIEAEYVRRRGMCN